MRTILTRRAILALVSGALAVAIIAAAALFQLAQTPHATQRATAIHSGSSMAYTVVLAPPAHARHLQSQPSGAPSSGKTTTAPASAQPSVALVDNGDAIGPKIPQYTNFSPTGVAVPFFVTLQNTGTTTWTTAAGYGIQCVSPCFGATSIFWPTGTVAPQGTVTVQVQLWMPAPFATTTTPVQWALVHNGVTFGSPITINITPLVTTSVIAPTTPWCSDLYRWGAANLTGGNTASCTASGIVLQTAGGMGPNLWLARPPLDFAKSNYRLQVQVHFASVTPNEWVSILMNESSWDQCPTDRLDYSPINGFMEYYTSPASCTPAYPSSRWEPLSGVGQDMTIGVVVEQGNLTIYLNGAAVAYTVAYTGGSIGLALGSAPGQTAQVTLSNFELDTNIIYPYTTYVLPQS